MQIKQFSGDSVDEILKEIREELGDDAVILQTKRIVRGGIGGFFGKQGVEVTAAEGLSGDEAEAATENLEAARSAAAPVPGEPEGPETSPETAAPAFSRHLSGQLAAAVEAETFTPSQVGPEASPAAAYARAGAAPARPFAPGDAQRTQAIIEAAREALREAHRREAESEPLAAAAAAAAATVAPPPFLPAPPAVQSPPDAQGVEAPPLPATEPEIDAFVPEIPTAPVHVSAPAARAPEPPAPRVSLDPVRDEVPADASFLDDHAAAPVPEGASDLPAAMARARSELVAFGVAERYLDPLIAGFLKGGVPFAEAGEDDLREFFRRWLIDRLPVVRDWKPAEGARTIALVGQHGTGKTAVAAKLAGRHAAAGLAVGLIGAGPGAHAALKEHAGAIGVSVALAPDAASLGDARAGFGDRDLIIVDTPGSSAQDLDEMESLAALAKSVDPDEVHLVLPVSYSLADLGDVARRFRMTGFNRVALTKLDETRFAGNVLNFPLRLGKPLSYLADGPEVPGALHQANARDIGELLLP